MHLDSIMKPSGDELFPGIYADDIAGRYTEWYTEWYTGWYTEWYTGWYSRM